MRGILKRIGWTATNTQTKMLRSIASQALRHARPVISNFSVAAAGIAVGRFNMPRVVTGSNVETQNTADSIHAEESLVAKLRQGEQLTRVIILAGIGIPVAPCGSCREVLAAHSTPDAEALVQVAPGAEKWLKINDLLPTVSATPVPLANSSASVTRLFRQAEALLDTPYTPYVQRPRAAAVLTEQGHIFAASGREDAAFHHPLVIGKKPTHAGPVPQQRRPNSYVDGIRLAVRTQE